MRSWLLVAAVFSVHVFGGGEEFLRPLEGMQGLSIRCDSQEKLSLIESYKDHPDFDFLSITRVLGNEIKILVPENQLDDFKIVLKNNEIDYVVFIENMADEVREDYISNQIARNRNLRNGKNGPLKFYPRLSEIETYLKSFVAEYEKTVSLIKIGDSHEGRPIWVLKISSGPGDKPAILIDAGIHAREWIAPSTALYAIHQLVVNKTNSGLYENVDWYILPSLNPDGYEFTHTSYRLWRKTRSQNSVASCRGTDPNRNFDYKWMTVGASSNPCSEIYAGQKAFSEIETSSLRDFVLANKKSIKLYLTLHSYGQYLLHPWGYTTALPENEPVLRKLAVAADNALASVYGTRYTIGSSTNVLYAAAGGSDDWVMAVGGVPLSYTIELPGGGNAGFNPPPSRIEPVGIETFEAFRVFGKYVAANYV